MIFDKNAAALFDAAAVFFATGGESAEYCRRMLWLMREACRKGSPMESRLLTLCSVLEGFVKTNFAGGSSKRARWQLSFAKAGLTWDSGFDEMFDAWEGYRNKLAHGFDPHPDEERSPALIFNAYSRITAGIYILMAKRMRFTGLLWRSYLENASTLSLASHATSASPTVEQLPAAAPISDSTPF